MRSSGRKILQSTALVMGLTLLAKASGFVRDIVVASYFGTSATMDAFFVAMTIMGLLVVWLRDPIQVTLIPLFTKELTTYGEQSAWAKASVLLNTLFMLYLGVTVLGWFLSPYLVILVAPGLRSEIGALAADLAKTIMLSVLFLGLARLLSALFYAYHRFGRPGITTSLDNLVVVMLVVMLTPALGVYALAIGTVAGAVAQTLVQLPILWRNRAYYLPRVNLKDPIIRRMAWLSLPLLVGTGGAEVDRITDRVFASLLPAGSLSALAYGHRLTYAMFFQLFVASLTTVLFPYFSRSADADHYANLSQKLFKSLRVLFWIAFPLSIGLALLHEPLVRLIYQRGAFTEHSVVITGQAVFYYALGLSMYSVSYVLTYAFYSIQDTKTPVLIGLVRVGVKILLSFALIGSLAHAGLALADSLSFVLKTILLLAFLPKALKQAEYWTMLQSFAFTIAITAGMGAVLFLALPYFETVFAAGASVAAISTGLAAAIILGSSVYLLSSILCQRPEVRDVYQLVRAAFAKS